MDGSKLSLRSMRSIDDGALESIKHSKVRSVFLFNVDKLPDSFMNASIANFKLMKVLDLEDAPVDYLPEGVGNLFNLHYLSVKNTNVKKIPKSIGNLLGLEILDLKNSLVRELPVEIRNLKKLRYLMVYKYNYTAGATLAGEAAAKLHEFIDVFVEFHDFLDPANGKFGPGCLRVLFFCFFCH
ncbi:hypothetical protein WN944_005956 [Citrus x changshan-huyou]|uniref:Disease resistance R13L4/SHOC-2-like LRR domain-containing protein n=1 Tax=Citrus x changshan-huyou TaxID=2935761 RepID=A0AAP0MPN2_9ROSI